MSKSAKSGRIRGSTHLPTYVLYYYDALRLFCRIFFTAQNDFVAYVLARPTLMVRRAFSCTTSLSFPKRSLYEEINFADNKDIETSDRVCDGQVLYLGTSWNSPIICIYSSSRKARVLCYGFCTRGLIKPHIIFTRGIVVY